MALSEDVAQVREDVAYIRGRIEDWDTKFGDHEDRLRKLERWPKIGGGLGALLAIIGGLFGLTQ